MNATDALRRHNLTPLELAKLAHAAANDGLRRMNPPPPLDPQERQDLIGSLIEFGLKWALVYNPALDQRAHFPTSVYSRMRRRVTDWCRTNIHDARYGTDKRHLTLDVGDWEHGPSVEATEPETRKRHAGAAHPTVPWADNTRDAFIEPDFQEMRTSRMRVERYEQAAEHAGVPVERWIVDALDAAADDEMGEAA